MVGAPADKVLRIPVDGDVEGWQEFHQRLGAPKEASGYDIPVADGDEVGKLYTDHMKESFLKMGLTPEQAKAVSQATTEFRTAADEYATQQYELDTTSAVKNLKREWGNGYERQMNVAKKAVSQLVLLYC